MKTERREMEKTKMPRHHHVCTVIKCPGPSALAKGGCFPDLLTIKSSHVTQEHLK